MLTFRLPSKTSSLLEFLENSCTLQPAVYYVAWSDKTAVIWEIYYSTNFTTKSSTSSAQMLYYRCYIIL